MIYQTVYRDADGNELKTATFAASGPQEALTTILKTPSLHPPPGTDSIAIGRIEDEQQ